MNLDEMEKWKVKLWKVTTIILEYNWVKYKIIFGYKQKFKARWLTTGFLRFFLFPKFLKLII